MTASRHNQTGKRWKVRNPDPGLQNAIAASFNILPLTSQILINRGISDLDQAGRFLSSTLADIRSPLDMKGMKEGVERVVRALQKKEKIAVFGDYDVDGMTATSILLLFLRAAGGDVSYYIPARISEGYGLNCGAVRKLKERGATLLITTDCGISNNDEVKLAKELGMDVIVTDHHEVPDEIPPAYAVINPKQPGCPFPFKGLAGVGVAFNLIIALRAALRDEGFWGEREAPNLKEYLDIVALGTVADVVPLVDENRIFVKYGLVELTGSKKPGIMALKEVSGIEDAVTSAIIGYRLAPRLNAAGRVGKGEDGVRLLTSTDFEEAMRIARLLDEGNRERQAIEEAILNEAIEMISSSPSMKGRRAIVLASEGWHPGVIGIVASRIAERYYRPTILIAIKDGVGKGSARSIPAFVLYEGLKKCSHLLEAYGGHDYAAGISLKTENIERFREEFEKIVSGSLTEEDMIPEIEIDATLKLNEITEGLINELENLAPFGEANPEPVLCSTGLNVADCRIVGNNHLKLKVRRDNTVLDAIGFGMGGSLNGISGSNGLNIAFFPQINSWNRMKSIQLKLKDIMARE